VLSGSGSRRTISKPLIKVLAATISVILISLPAVAQTFNDAGFFSERVSGVQGSPIGFVFTPDGRIFVWSKPGVIRVIKNGAMLATPFIDISDHVNRSVDRGLDGVALDPDFANNGYVYLAYVYEPPGGDTQSTAPRTQRVTRVQANPANPDVALSGETVILGSVTDPNCAVTSDCMPNESSEHTINQLSFGPDSKLYLVIGDGHDISKADPNALRAQNLDSLVGKVLRFNKDGSGLTDNPFFDGNAASNRSKVYSYGLRNPYRFSFDSNGTIYIGDVGENTWEEINRGKGQNFGWPCYEGKDPMPLYQSAFTQCQQLSPSQVTQPMVQLAHSAGTKCIIMGPTYSGNTYPAQYKGNLFWADFVGKWIYRVTFDASGNMTGNVQFATGLGSADYDGPVYFSQGPDGNLYYLMLASQQLRRIKFSGSLNAPPTVAISATPTSGLSPLTVQFSSAGSKDPEGKAVTYAWDFGDGSTSTDANPTHIYNANGVQKFTAKLTVSDPDGGSASDTVLITVGDRAPTAAISTPADGTAFTPGQTVTFQGSATDPEDGPLTGGSLRWQVLLLHTDHTHFILDTTGSGGSFVVEDHGAIGTFKYIIKLTATDSSGVSDVKQVTLPVVGPDFTISATPTATTVSPGGSGTFTVSVAPAAAAAYNASVALACANPPAGVTCSFSPASVIPGSSTVTSTLTVALATTVAQSSRPPLGNSIMLAFSIFGMVLVWRGRRRKVVPLIGIALLMIGMMACGSSGDETPGGGQPKTFPLSVTGTAGTTSHSTTINITHP
jgi:glucose/arabinose dehydrogenase